jgi:hypothetical protein
MISWQYYPKSKAIPASLQAIVDIFNQHSEEIDSSKHCLNSNGVLRIIRGDLVNIDFKVENGFKIEDKVRVAVLFGRNGQLEKPFDVDAFQEKTGTVLEVEAGRAVTNNQFLKDLFEACMMYNTKYLAIAVRQKYRKNQKDFEKVITFFDTLYASGRLNLPLEGILIIGY